MQLACIQVPVTPAILVSWVDQPVKEGMGEKRVEAPPSLEPSLAGLIKAVAEDGDRRAFASLFDHFAPRLKGYLRRLGADEPTAEDLVQDVMLTVWRQARQYDAAQAGVATWLFTIARNRRIDAFRRENRPEFDPHDPALVPEADPSADAVLETAQSSRRVADALSELPPEQADLIRLAYFEDKSHSAIAQELELPLGTVKSRVRLALAKLRVNVKDIV